MLRSDGQRASGEDASPIPAGIDNEEIEIDKNSAGIPGIIHSGFLILSHGFLCESAFILCAFVRTLVTSKWEQPLLLPLIVDDVVLIASCAISFDRLQPLDSSLTLGLSV